MDVILRVEAISQLAEVLNISYIQAELIMQRLGKDVTDKREVV